MDTIFVTNEALNISIKHDSLFSEKLNQISDLSVVETNYLDILNGVLITGIICGTILLIVYWVYQLYLKKTESKPNENQNVMDDNTKYELRMKEALYQELKLYRSQLVNFMEKRAITKEAKCTGEEELEYTTRSFNKDDSDIYINQLKQYIDDLSNKIDKPLNNPKPPQPND